MTPPKKILVLARRDHLEAMRVAAGLTIFGHQLRLVFMSRQVSEEVATSEQAELLELSGIEPETTLPVPVHPTHTVCVSAPLGGLTVGDPAIVQDTGSL